MMQSLVLQRIFPDGHRPICARNLLRLKTLAFYGQFFL